MQVWRGTSAAPCLVSSIRPLLPSTSRAFTTTPFLQRSKSKPKIRASTPPSKGLGLGTGEKNGSGNSFQQSTKEAQQSVNDVKSNVTGDSFLAVIENALEEIKDGIDTSGPKSRHWEDFRKTIIRVCVTPETSLRGDSQASVLKNKLEQSFIVSGTANLGKKLLQEFRNFNLDNRFSRENVSEQKKIADIRYPAEWYPGARAIQRKIHLHVGPTNSGKTYHALKRLEEAKSGFYAGPLRLLAHEVYTRLNAKGIPCGLVTGDEVKLPEEEQPMIHSNTVEMVPLSKDVEVAVIDEIQMIGNEQRGWAWTRALLGSQASEVHLCGETRVVPLVREIVNSLGDTLEIHNYQRLNPLKALSTSLKGNFRNLRKGDCVVSFSRIQIHALKQEIERVTGRRAAIVYGSLPAEIRSQQADLFNDPNNDYDFLVASDAIGMGLNLSCKRIIFETLVRRLPSGLERLKIPHIKQIAGRAGRYRAAGQGSDKNSGSDDSSNVGFVTSLEDVDLPYIHEALRVEPQPITTAGILPPDEIIQRFHSYFPASTPLPYILQRLHSISKVNPRYFLCDIKEQCATGEIVDNVDNLNIADRLIFIASPASSRDATLGIIVQAFAKCVAEHKSGSLLDISELDMEILDEPVSSSKDYMRSLESFHRAIVLYLWLSYRCGGIFTDRTLATHVKGLVEERMDKALTEFSANRKLRKESSLQRQLALMRQVQERERMFNDGQSSGEPPLVHPDETSVSEGHTILYESEESPKTRYSTATT